MSVSVLTGFLFYAPRSPSCDNPTGGVSSACDTVLAGMCSSAGGGAKPLHVPGLTQPPSPCDFDHRFSGGVPHPGGTASAVLSFAFNVNNAARKA